MACFKKRSERGQGACDWEVVEAELLNMELQEYRLAVEGLEE
jgi:hypothetical protein